MNDSGYHDRMRRYVDDLREQVAKHGWIIQAVFDPDGTTKDGFSYTVGLHGRQIPEIMLAGYHPDMAHYLLTQVANQAVDKWIPGFSSQADFNAMELTVSGFDESSIKHEVKFHSWSIFDRNRPSFASEVYEKSVPYVHLEIPGWPCPRCTPLVGANVECTCRFSCWYKRCDAEQPPETV
jgi:hypothetical protein